MPPDSDDRLGTNAVVSLEHVRFRIVQIVAGVVSVKISVLVQLSQERARLRILCRELKGPLANSRVGMLQKPVEGFPFPSTDDALPSHKPFEVAQVLAILQLGLAQSGAFFTKMARMPGA